jgi:hypothetical protein
MTAKVHVAYKTTSGNVIANCKSMKRNWIPTYVLPAAFDKLPEEQKCTHCAIDLKRKRAKAAA